MTEELIKQLLERPITEQETKDQEGIEYIRQLLDKKIQYNEEEATNEILERRKAKFQKLTSDSGIPKRFQSRTFEKFQVTPNNKKAYEKAKEWAENFPNTKKGLLFIGNYGTGKTHLSVAIANYLMSKFYEVHCSNTTDIISRVKETYAKGSEMTEHQFIQKFVKADLIILDDLGKENATSNTTSVVYQIINQIYEEEKPIIVTTNLGSKELINNLGEKGGAITSRLFEMCEVIELNGKDWRIGL